MISKQKTGVYERGTGDKGEAEKKEIHFKEGGENNVGGAKYRGKKRKKTEESK